MCTQVALACGQPAKTDAARLGTGGTPVAQAGSGGTQLPSTGGENSVSGSGGDTGSGNANAGGTTSGGTTSGGSTSTGGSLTGGGGAGDGGSAAGGSNSAAGGTQTNFEPSLIIGADISGTQEVNVSYIDTDGQTKSLFELLANHGFNYIRLRTFVDPLAPYGYASSANDCGGNGEAYGDKEHVIAYGKQAKEHGMGFLLDFHYSDVWADPGNQIIPEAFRAAANIDELAALSKAYTKDVLSDAIAQGARPDMVQIGNEITPGMMAHLPGPNTDCWGNNPASAPFGGGTSNWDNLATLLTANIEAVRELDPTIKIMLHIENTDHLSGVRSWVQSALARDVDFDVLGLSCYTAFQGEPSVWKTTFETMASEFPELSFVIAEYNPARTEANRIMKDLPDGRGLGTFFWEPTQSGEWGDSMFDWQDGAAVARPEDFAEYDNLPTELGL